MHHARSQAHRSCSIPRRLVSSAVLWLAAAAPLLAQTETDRARSSIEELPGLGTLSIESVQKLAEGVFRVDVPAQGVLALGFQSRATVDGPWHAGILLADPRSFSFQQLYPLLSREFLGDALPAQLLLVSSSKNEKVASARFPAQLRQAVNGFADSSGDVQLQEGVNIFATLATTEQGLLGFLRHALDVSQPVRLKGQIDGESVEYALRAAGLQNSSFKPENDPPKATRLSLTLSFPEFVPPPFEVVGDPQVVDLRYGTTDISIRAESETKGKASSEKYAVAGVQRVKLWLLGKPLEFDAALEVEVDDKKVAIKRSGSAKVEWRDAFGLQGVTLRTLSLGGALETSKKGELGPIGVELGATLDFPRHGELKGAFAFGVEGQKLREVKLLLEGKKDQGLELGSLPGFARIPGMDEIRIDKLAIGIDPLQRDVYVQGQATWTAKMITGQAAVLVAKAGRAQPACILFLQVDGLSLRKLLPELPPNADVIQLDRALLAVSTEDFKDLKARSLPGVFKEMMGKVTSDLDKDMPVFKGVTLFTRFAPETLPANLRQSLADIGISEPIVLAGSVGGLLDKEPSLALYADLPTLPVFAKKPAFLDLQPKLRGPKAQSAGAKVFVVAKRAAKGFELELGLEASVGVRVADDDLVFRGQAFVLVTGISQGFRVSGQMQGEWKDPFGLTGITYRDLIVGGGVDADSSIEVALGGMAKFGNLQYDVGGVVSLVAASGGLVPKKVGLKFEGSEISQLTQLQIMAAFVKAAASGPLASAIAPGETQNLLRQLASKDLVGNLSAALPLPLMRYRDVGIFLVTPGASFPGLELNGLGVGIQGSLEFMKHDFGSVDNYLTLRDGLQVHGAPGKFDLGVVSLADARMHLRMPMPGLPTASGEKPGFALKGKLGAGCSLLQGSLDVQFGQKQASFVTSTRLAGYQTSLSADVDLSKWPDFGLRGRFDGELVRDVLEMVKTEMRSKSQQALDEAQRVVAQTRAAAELAQAESEKAVEKGRAELRAKAQQALDKVGNSIKALANQHSNRPLLHAALEKASDIAAKLKLAKDDSVENLANLRAKLQQAGEEAAKLPGNLAKEVSARLSAVRADLDAAAAQIANLKKNVQQLPAVRAAETKLADAQAAVAQLKSNLAAKIEPLAVAAQSVLESFAIEEIGFDSGVEVLCQGKLPRLNVTGTFAGKRFDLKGPLQLASSGELAARNREDLTKLVATLFQHVDPREAERVTRELAAR